MQKRYFWFIISLLLTIGLIYACEKGNNSSLSGQVVEKDGYQYIYHIQNKGATPKPSEFALYHHTLSADDSLIMNSRDLNLISKMQIPTSSPEENKIQQPQPVLTGLKTMSVGDSITIKIPMNSLPKIPPSYSKYKFLIYDIILVDIKTQEEVMTASSTDAKRIEARRREDMARESAIADSLQETLNDYKSGKLDGQLKETQSGLKYLIHEEGSGKKPRIASPIRIHYYGILPDGTQIDNSFQRGSPITFTVGGGQVIMGWDEWVKLTNIGSKGTLFIPSELGFDEEKNPPSIPPNSDLIFYVESYYPYGELGDVSKNVK